MLLPLRHNGAVRFDDRGEFKETYCESCFEISLIASKLDENSNATKISISVEPLEGGYELLISYLININGIDHWIDRDLWKIQATVWEETFDVDELSIGFAVDVIEILAPINLQEEGGYRNFRVLSSRGAYYINPTAISQLGGSLFSDWFRRDCEGEKTAVATDLHEDELDELLKACCAYSTVVIYKQVVDIHCTKETAANFRNNFKQLLPIAWRFKIVGVLSEIERYILHAKSIHPISKLDFASYYKLTLLSREVLRLLGAKHQRQDVLDDYLRKCQLKECPSHIAEMLQLET